MYSKYLQQYLPGDTGKHYLPVNTGDTVSSCPYRIHWSGGVMAQMVSSPKYKHDATLSSHTALGFKRNLTGTAQDIQ